MRDFTTDPACTCADHPRKVDPACPLTLAVSAGWTPARGWHDVTEHERRAMQRDAVARLTGRTVTA